MNGFCRNLFGKHAPSIPPTRFWYSKVIKWTNDDQQSKLLREEKSLNGVSKLILEAFKEKFYEREIHIPLT